MFEFYNNILSVQGGWLYSEGDVMSKSNYDNLVRRNWLKTVRRACKGTPALIQYDSIPERFKKVIVEKFGDPHKATKNSHFTDYLQQDLKAIEFYNNYTLDSGEALPEKSKLEYIANANVLNAVHEIVSNMGAKRRSMGGNTSKIWETMVGIISELPRHTYPHSLPKNARRLKEKLKTYLANGYETLIHKGFCNNNSEKINDAAKMWVLSRWTDNVNRCTGTTQLLAEYNAKATVEEWKKLKNEETLRIFLDERKDMWFGHRYGELKFKEKFVYQHSTKMPSMRDSLWYSDGTKLNYYYLTEEGKIETCQVYEVMDAFSEVLLGYHISKSEDYEAQFNAYKMAIQCSGYRPYQIGLDNQSGHKKLENSEFYNKICKMAIRTQPYNGKSKTIESAFGRFQKQYLKRDWFFTGQNITAKTLESKANMEYIMANKHELPTLDQVKEVYQKRREEWNNAPHYATGIPKADMYRNNANPETTKVGIWDMVDMFWMLREKPVTCTAYGISFKEKKQEYTFMVNKPDGMPNLDWLKKNVDNKFYIKFDPQDMSMIYLYEKDALGLRFITEAHTKVEIHRGIQEQEAWERQFIEDVEKAKKEVRIQTRDQADAIAIEQGTHSSNYGMKPAPIKGLESSRKSKKDKKVIEPIDIEKAISNKVMIDEDDQDINMYAMM